MQVHGGVEDGFGPVADAFAENFAARSEVGAACAVYRDGLKIVDLWAGSASRVTRWTRRTPVPVLSVSKGLIAIAAYRAHQRGQLDFDAPVTRYWPEYGTAGKANTTVRDLFSHRAGLPAPAARLTLVDLDAWTPVIDALQSQAPLWIPGTTFAYHALTFGWLTGEVLR
jgi:CubicO group peptidase (beta-lactamase class C family)